MTTETTQTSSTETEQIARAVNYLDATRLEDGDYSYYAAETRRNYRVTADEMADLGRRLIAGEPDAYSFWCADTDADPMPESYSIAYEPEQVPVSDDRGTVAGARCVVTADCYGHETRLSVIPREGDSADCWLGHVGVELDERLWDALASAAERGARGESGTIEGELE